jgi:PIN domain nuclease of toxin-antitoxin system
MRILLDTNILYWWFYETPRLSSSAVALVKEADAVYVSSVSLWELAIKFRLGKIKPHPAEFLKLIQATDFIELPVKFKHALPIADMPLIRADPFDRLLIAQAMLEPTHLITSDRHLRQYSDLVIEV